MKSTQRKFLADEINETAAMRGFQQVTADLKNLGDRLDLEFGCDSDSMLKATLMSAQLSEAFEMSLCYTAEMALLTNDNDIIQNNLYGMILENEHQKLLLTMRCSNTACPMNGVWDRLEVERSMYRDGMMSMYDGFNGIRQGMWAEAKGVFERILNLYVPGCKGSFGRKLDSKLFEKILKEMETPNGRKRLQEKLSVFFFITRNQSVICKDMIDKIKNMFDTQT